MAIRYRKRLIKAGYSILDEQEDYSGIKLIKIQKENLIITLKKNHYGVYGQQWVILITLPKRDGARRGIVKQYLANLNEALECIEDGKEIEKVVGVKVMKEL